MKTMRDLERLLNGFGNMPEQSLATMELARENGRKVVGIYCIFAPVEIIRAAGALPVGLCGKRAEPIPAAEAELPANLCPLIKSSYGYAVTGTCPFFGAADAVVGETTCDGKKKMYEFLREFKPLHLMHLPYAADMPHAQAFWYAEIVRLAKFLQDLTGNRITEEALREQICLQNEVRRLLCELHHVNAAGDDVHVSGKDMLAVLEAKNFCPDVPAYIHRLKELIGALRALPAQAKRPARRRIVLTGTPIGKGSEKVLRLIEDAGAVVVGMENCTGLKSAWSLVDQQTPDPLLAIARSYLSLPCACMAPNAGRLALLREMVSAYRAEGVVDLSWHACHTYMIESNKVASHLQSHADIPLLHLCTDYGKNDLESLRTRIEAFLEML